MKSALKSESTLHVVANELFAPAAKKTFATEKVSVNSSLVNK